MRHFFQRNRRRIFLLAVLAVSFLTISYNISRTDRASRLGFHERLVFWLVSPFQRGATTIKSFFEIAWYKYIYLIKLKEKNEVMEDRLGRLEAEVARLREKAGASERLAELLQFKETNPYELKVARIIGFDSAGYNRTVTLDKGAADGVGPNMPVVTARGVVGRVVKVHPAYCQALLLVDYNSAIDAVIQRTRDKGIVVGLGGAMCEMKYVDRQSDVQVGDLAVTSGLTGIFPPGLLIGEVSEVQKEGPGLFQSVKVKPAVRVDRLEEVLMLLKEKA